MGLLGQLSARLSSVIFYLICFFCVIFSLILMKLGVSDLRTRGYKVTELILNVCITVKILNLLEDLCSSTLSYIRVDGELSL